MERTRSARECGSGCVKRACFKSMDMIRQLMMMMTFITQGGEGRGDTSKESEATKSKGRGLEEGASRALMRQLITRSSRDFQRFSRRVAEFLHRQCKWETNQSHTELSKGCA